MAQEQQHKSFSLSYRTIAVLLLLWGCAYASMLFYTFVLAAPADLADIVEAEDNAVAYASYVESIPLWATVAAGFIAITRVLGGLCLVMRNALAVPLYGVSLVLVTVTMIRGFFLDGAAANMGVIHIGIEVIMVSLSIFALWFSIQSRAKGMLA